MVENCIIGSLNQKRFFIITQNSKYPTTYVFSHIKFIVIFSCKKMYLAHHATGYKGTPIMKNTQVSTTHKNRQSLRMK